MRDPGSVDYGLSVRLIQARRRSSWEAFADAHTVRAENHKRQIVSQRAPVSPRSSSRRKYCSWLDA
jgi:hypothetical protein